MSWRDGLSRAAFRGVEFHVAAHEAGMGRRVQLHEYPLRDKPYAEDLGRRARTLSVEAYVLGDDYMARRDALVRAIEQPGPGTLQHPYLGEMRGSVVGFTLTESSREGGVARFVLQFVESGDAEFPRAAVNTGAAVAAAGEAAQQAVQQSFERRHRVAGRPQFVVEASATIFSGALERVRQTLGLVRGPAARVAALNRHLQDAERDLTSLLYEPAAAGHALAGAPRLLRRTVAAARRDALAAARGFYSFGTLLPPVQATTGSRRAQAVNQQELVGLVRVVAAAEAARAAADAQFESYQEAVGVRDEIVDTLDDVMLGDIEDGTYDALRALRSATVRDITTRGADLARLISWAPPSTMPVLAVAHELYADATRAAELVQRNRLRHPLFVPGAWPLEVLSDAR